MNKQTFYSDLEDRKLRSCVTLEKCTFKWESLNRPFLRFLWRNDETNVIDQYQFHRVPFGMNASPFLAQFVSQYNARKFEQEYQLAAIAVIKSTYMDDTMDSVKSEEIGIKMSIQLQDLWQKASMSPRKWLSNSPEVLKRIPK